MKLEPFDDVLKAIKSNRNRCFSLLLGNGFSIAYSPDIFSYNALHDFISKLDDELLSKLLNIVKAKDFERIMQELDTFSALLDVFGSDKELREKVNLARAKLKKKLIEAVRALHPEHVFTIPKENSESCAKFLSAFFDRGGKIYTTNYDLLLYWVLMRNSIEGHVDGFGRDRESPDEFVPDEELEYSELRWGRNKENQNVFYIHGALPLFDTGVEIVKEEYDNQNYLLENITQRMDEGAYPIFVTAGNGEEKLTHIMHNRYLSNCYENLSEVNGSLVTYGFRFGEQDAHIINAINTAAKGRYKSKEFLKLFSIYIGVYSNDDKRYIEKIEDKFKCKVHIYDAKTVDIWGKRATSS